MIPFSSRYHALFAYSMPRVPVALIRRFSIFTTRLLRMLTWRITPFQPSFSRSPDEIASRASLFFRTTFPGPSQPIKAPPKPSPQLHHPLPSPLTQKTKPPPTTTTMDEVLSWTSVDPRTSVLFNMNFGVTYRFTTVRFFTTTLLPGIIQHVLTRLLQ